MCKRNEKYAQVEMSGVCTKLKKNLKKMCVKFVHIPVPKRVINPFFYRIYILSTFGLKFVHAIDTKKLHFAHWVMI